jgi:hypothetical protein
MSMHKGFQKSEILMKSAAQPDTILQQFCINAEGGDGNDHDPGPTADP